MKQKLLFNHFGRIALCGCLAAVASSCVDNDYDLDNGISSEANILNGLTIPVGSIDNITLGDMLDTASIEMLSIVDGKYVISTSDQFDADMDEFSDDLSFSIEGITESVTIDESIASDIELSAFDINVSDGTEVNTGLTSVVIESSETISASNNIAPEYPAEISNLSVASIAGVPIGEISIPMETSSFDQSIILNIDADCPTYVESVSGIKFGENGEGVDVTIKLDISALTNVFSDITWEYPSLYLEFPEGFVLGDANGSNNALFEGANVTSTGSVELKTKLMAYNGTLSPSELSSFNCSVICELGDGSNASVTIKSATTNGATLDLDKKFSVDITSEALLINDLTLAVDGVEIPVDGMSLSESASIDVSDKIESVEYVSFKSGSNAFNIELSRVALPEGLAISSDNDITIGFPADRFTISEATGAVIAADGEGMRNISIESSDLVGTGTINKSILLNTIVLDGCPVVEGILAFETGIQLTGTTLLASGDISLSAYNAYVDEYATQQIDFSAMAENLEIDIAEFTTSAIEVSLSVDNPEFSINEEIPSELEALYSLSFAEEVTASINVTLSGLPYGESAGELAFDNYTIAFPEFIVFADGEVDENNCLVLNENVGSKLSQTRTFTRTLHIESFNFDPAKYPELITIDGNGDSYISLNEEIELSGDLVLNGGSASTDIDKIAGVVKFTLSDMEVGLVTGRLNAGIDDISEMIDMSELSEELEAIDGLTIVLSNPMVSLSIYNSLPIGLTIGELSLVPYKGGVALDPYTLSESITVAAAEATAAEGTYAVTDITIGAQASSSDGYYQIVGLEEILNDLPDSLKFEAAAKVSDGDHSIDLSRNYDLKVDYAVSVPLEFESLELIYTDTLTDISSSLEDVIDYLTSLELQIQTTSTLPISIEVSQIKALDAFDNVLNLPEMLPASNSIDGSADGTPVSSQFNITIADNATGDLVNLDKLLLTVKAATPESTESVALEASQYISFGFKLKLPDGLTLDWDEAFEDDDDEE